MAEFILADTCPLCDRDLVAEADGAILCPRCGRYWGGTGTGEHAMVRRILHAALLSFTSACKGTLEIKGRECTAEEIRHLNELLGTPAIQMDPAAENWEPFTHVVQTEGDAYLVFCLEGPDESQQAGR